VNVNTFFADRDAATDSVIAIIILIGFFLSLFDWYL
jgi:hypothetical protein